VGQNSIAKPTVFLGCHERDPHIPLARVQESRAVFKRLGASVRVEIFPGTGHGVVTEEVLAIRGILNR
jgi:phospholipase/carboxylesterase